MSASVDTIRSLAEQDYKWGFVTEIDADSVPKGLNEETVRLISARKGEPEFMLEWRLNALRHWSKMERDEGAPKWANLTIAPIDYQDIVYYSAPKQRPVVDSLDKIDPELLRTYEKLGIPLDEQKLLSGVAVDAVFDSVLSGDHIQEQAGGDGRDLLLVFRGGAEAPGAGEEVSGHGGSAYRQLLRGAECGGVYRWIVCVRSEGRALPDGAFDVFPHQRRGDGAV